MRNSIESLTTPHVSFLTEEVNPQWVARIEDVHTPRSAETAA